MFKKFTKKDSRWYRDNYKYCISHLCLFLTKGIITPLQKLSGAKPWWTMILKSNWTCLHRRVQVETKNLLISIIVWLDWILQLCCKCALVWRTVRAYEVRRNINNNNINLVSSLALSVFLASAAYTTFLQDLLLPSATSYPDQSPRRFCL